MNKKAKVTVFGIVIILAIILIAYVAIALTIGVIIEHNNSYEMPNGVVCEDKISSDSGYKFINCNDGERYINPEHYRVVRNLNQEGTK